MTVDPTTFRFKDGLLVPTSLGYHAVSDKGRRQSPKSRVKPEFSQLTARDRSSLDATIQDLPRNFELAAWMVRMHVEYVSQFELYVNTGDEDLDKILEDLFDWHAHKDRFDVARRHGRDEAMRLFEIAKVFSGDAAFNRLPDGDLQLIPGRRIAKPTKFINNKATQELLKTVNDRGLIVDKTTGRVLKACMCHWSDDGNHLEFDHLEEWENLIYDGYFTDADQDRGVSPIASAVNRMTDTMEALEWTNLKIKLHALFGVAFGREGAEGSPFGSSPDTEDVRGATDTTQPGRTVTPAKGIMTFDLEPGETIDTVESKTPASEFVDYTGLSIRLSMLALDIPYTMFDSRASSYSARIADSNVYEFMSIPKRSKNQATLKSYSDWKVSEWMRARSKMFAPLRDRASAIGMSMLDVQKAVSWVGRQLPWIDKLKQIEGDEKAVALGIDSRTRITRRRGLGPWREIAEELGKEEAMAAEYGATLGIGSPGQETTSARDVKTITKDR